MQVAKVITRNRPGILTLKEEEKNRDGKRRK